MASKTTHLSARLPKRSEPKSSPDGKRAVGNKILRDLLADERNLVSSKLEPVALKVHDVLHEPGAPIEFGYFPERGIVSILSVLSDGKSLEVGLGGTDRQGRLRRPATDCGFSQQSYQGNLSSARFSIENMLQHWRRSFLNAPSWKRHSIVIP
jgi:CRP-like cAMP-binding protein